MEFVWKFYETKVFGLLVHFIYRRIIQLNTVAFIKFVAFPMWRLYIQVSIYLSSAFILKSLFFKSLTTLFVYRL